MNNIFAIVGGDKRHILLAEKLKIKGKVEIYGLDKKLPSTNSLANVIGNSNIIISAIPFTRDNIHINTPLSNEKIQIKRFNELTKDKLVLTGTDFLENEEYNIFNAELTTEAIIGILINELHIRIMNSSVLILGYGRIGRILLKYLKKLYSNVYCTYNNEKEKAWIKVNKGIPIEFNKIQNFLNIRFDCIINTIPDVILKEAELKLIKDTIILDIASEKCLNNNRILEINNIQYFQKLGLPGKYFPYISADIMENIILEKIKII